MSLQHDVVADSGKLMNAGAPAEEAVVADGDVPSEHGIVGENVIVSNNTVMAQVGADHEEVILTDHRFAAFGQTAVNGDIFPNRSTGPNDNGAAGLRIETNRLWITTDDAAGPDVAILSKGNFTQEMHVRMYSGTMAYGGVGFNDGKCTNFDIVGDVCFRADDSCLVYFQGYRQTCK